MMRLERGLVEQKLHANLLALRRHPLSVLDGVARLLEQVAGVAQHGAVLAGAVGDRRHEGLAEDLVGNLATERLEQRQLLL